MWLVETSDVDGRSYLAWTWFRGRLRFARLDLDQAAARYQEGPRRLSIRKPVHPGRLDVGGTKSGRLQHKSSIDGSDDAVPASRRRHDPSMFHGLQIVLALMRNVETALEVYVLTVLLPAESRRSSHG